MVKLKGGKATGKALTGDKIIAVRKKTQFDKAYTQALQDTLEEWCSVEDENAYRGL